MDGGYRKFPPNSPIMGKFTQNFFGCRVWWLSVVKCKVTCVKIRLIDNYLGKLIRDKATRLKVPRYLVSRYVAGKCGTL